MPSMICPFPTTSNGVYTPWRLTSNVRVPVDPTLQGGRAAQRTSRGGVVPLRSLGRGRREWQCQPELDRLELDVPQRGEGERAPAAQRDSGQSQSPRGSAAHQQQ